jgi:hypothetical protein
MTYNITVHHADVASIPVNFSIQYLRGKSPTVPQCRTSWCNGTRDVGLCACSVQLHRVGGHVEASVNQL